MGTSRLTSSLILLALVGCGKDQPKQEYVIDSTGGPAAPKPLMSVSKKLPVVSTLGATVTLQGDTSLRVITKWGYKTTPPVFPDSTRLKVGLGSTPPNTDKGKFVLWPKTVDTSFVAVSGYGNIVGYSCVVPHRGDTWAAQICTNWQFVRPEPQVPPFDTLSAQVASVVLEPNGIQVDFDSNAARGATTCARWQKNNPDKSPWVTINVKAVDQCTGVNNHPIVAQFCVWFIFKDGSTGLAANHQGTTEGANYCRQKYDEWLATRHV